MQEHVLTGSKKKRVIVDDDSEDESFLPTSVAYTEEDDPGEDILQTAPTKRTKIFTPTKHPLLSKPTKKKNRPSPLTKEERKELKSHRDKQSKYQ